MTADAYATEFDVADLFPLFAETAPGVYVMQRQAKYPVAAAAVYKKAFLLKNPNYGENVDVENNPYFEFIR